MKIYSIEYLPGKNYEPIGLVRGSTVQSKNVFKDIGAGLKNMVGGELKSYTKMLNEAREISISRMVEEAETLSADAILGVTFSTSSITEGAAEIMVVGTAVKYVD